MDDVLGDRAVPADDLLRDFFWRSGQDGKLRIQRCGDCGSFNHPPGSRCAFCMGAGVAPAVVSGLGTIHTYTVNVHAWEIGQQPYVIAIVELDEQPGLRLTTNIVGCPVDAVHIDQRVEVLFMARHGLWYPVFTPRRDRAGEC